MNPILIAKVAAGVMLLALLWFGFDRAVMAPRRDAAALRVQLDAEKARTESAVSERNAARRDLDNARQSERLVATYEEKIRELEARKPAVVVRLVERVCPAGTATGRDGVPLSAAAAGADADGASDAGAGFAADLTGDLIACKANAEQLTALQAWVRSVSPEFVPVSP